MGRPRIIEHGPRRPWWALWQKVCRCGLDAWPCPVVRMLERQAAIRPPGRNGRPGWDRPTANVLRAPLLTRGPAARARGVRW